MKYPEPEYAAKTTKIVDSLEDVIDYLEDISQGISFLKKERNNETKITLYTTTKLDE